LVDRSIRDSAARVLKDLIEGRITNDAFMKTFPRSKNDSALNAILQFVWGQVSDFRVHTLTGRDKPPNERLDVLNRCYLFLTTDLKFEWPAPTRGIAKGLLQILTFGRGFRYSDNEYMAKGDFEVWPFLRKSDYAAHSFIRDA
jgi:hypothetical protein